MNKLKAYTLLELMIALMISGIVISLAAMSYLTIKKDLIIESKRQEQGQKLLRLHSLLRNDCGAARTIHYKPNVLHFQYHNMPENHYEFLDNYILRHSGYRTDTFPFQVKSIECNYLESDNRLVSSIQLITKGTNQGEQYIFLRKDYSGDILFPKFQNK